VSTLVTFHDLKDARPSVLTQLAEAWQGAGTDFPHLADRYQSGTIAELGDWTGTAADSARAQLGTNAQSLAESGQLAGRAHALVDEAERQVTALQAQLNAILQHCAVMKYSVADDGTVTDPADADWPLGLGAPEDRKADAMDCGHQIQQLVQRATQLDEELTAGLNALLAGQPELGPKMTGLSPVDHVPGVPPRTGLVDMPRTPTVTAPHGTGDTGTTPRTGRVHPAE
jgi:hypothetical protein